MPGAKRATGRQDPDGELHFWGRFVYCFIMATKTISLELDAYETLKAAKRPGESFSATVRRARFGPSDSTGRSVLTLLQNLNAKRLTARRQSTGPGPRRQPGP